MKESFEKSKRDPATTPGSAQEISHAMRDLDNENGLLEWHAEYLAEQQGIDHLTGLKSRKPFEEELERALKIIRGGEAKERRKSAESFESIIFIDIDRFKNINDTLGHAAGDEVLKKIAKSLASAVRASDMVARWGGEEFAILLRGTGAADAASEAEKLRKGIEQLEFEKYPDLKVTASVGVVSSEKSKDARVLLELADEAMYAAKEVRNKVHIYGT